MFEISKAIYGGLLLAFLNVVIVRYGHVSMELASGHISPFIIAEIAAFAGIFSCLCLSKGLTYGGASMN